MNTELKILKKISENNQKASIDLISREIGLGIDYIRYLCQWLKKKGKIEQVKGSRDWYALTSQGEKELKLRGIMELPFSKPEQKEEIEVEEKKLNLGKAIERAVSFLKRSTNKE